MKLIDSIDLRSWHEDDFEKSVVLNRESESVLGIPSESGDWAKDMLGIDDTFINSGGEFLVGYIQDHLILMGGFKPLSDIKAEVKRMRVDPAYQRQGLGTWLLEELENRMLEKGFEEVEISTLAAQTGAIALYESCGYEEFRRTQSSEIENGLEVVSFSKSFKK